MYLNKVQIIGNLTRDPEMRSLPSGIKVTTFSVATNRTWKDQSGAKKEAVEYHNVVSFGRPAEIIAQYMKKGSSIYVEGRIQTRSWDDKATSEKKYRTEIVVENFQFGSSGGGPGGARGATPGASSAGSYPKKESGAKESDSDGIDTIEYPSEESAVEDIPF